MGVAAKAASKAWRDAKQALERSVRELCAAALALGDARLDEKPKGSPNSHYVQLHGALQHSLYHGGQIALVKRALGLGS